MIPQLQQARKEIAQIHDIDRALNTDRGEVSALDLAKARERGVPLSGGLETAAKMGNSYAGAIRDASKVGSPGVNNLNSMLGGGVGGSIGASLGGPAGAAIGGVTGAALTPVMQSMVRKILLSGPYQRTLGTPNFDASTAAKAAAKIPLTPQEMAALRANIMAQQLKNQGNQP